MTIQELANSITKNIKEITAIVKGNSIRIIKPNDYRSNKIFPIQEELGKHLSELYSQCSVPNPKMEGRYRAEQIVKHICLER